MISFFHITEEISESFPRSSVGTIPLLTVNIEMIYFNSSSSKVLMNLFDMLDEKAAAGIKIVINWLYDEENDIALEYGEEFLEDLEDATFNLVRIHSEENDNKSI